MRLIHKLPFSPQEIESYRQLTFDNLTRGLKYLLDAMEDMDLKVSEENQPYLELVENASDLRDGEPFPPAYYEPLKALWADPNVQKAWERGNEAALPEKCVLPSLHVDTPLTFTPSFQSFIFFLIARSVIRPCLRASGARHHPMSSKNYWYHGNDVQSKGP
jgi:hypothetical protein